MSKQAGRMSQSANDFLTPYAPTIVSATDVGTARPFNNGAVSVTFTPTGPNAATSYTVTASTGQTATGASSPIIVTGIASGATPTFTVTGTNAAGTGAASAASSAVTVTTVPQAPTIGTATNVGTSRAFNNGAALVAFTPGSTGGKAIIEYLAVSNPTETSSTAGASSPLAVVNLPGGNNITFKVRARNANGESANSSDSNAVSITTVPATPGAPVAITPAPGVDRLTWTAPANGGAAITNYFWASSDGKSGNTSATTVDIGQEQGSAQTYTVSAQNGNGSSGTSAASNSVTTTFSFTPFSVFSFSPFGFSPFGVFSFSPFGFSPFGFSPFGFSPFGVFGFSPFSAAGDW